MNLKRLRGIATAAFITTAAVLLAGCMNDMAGSVEGTAEGMATLSLSATGIPDDYAEKLASPSPKEEGNARSILPDDPYDIGGIGSGSGQSDGLKLVLTGKSETGMTYGPTDVTLTETTPGSKVYDFTETITMDSMSWNLVLTAYADEAKTKPVLVGYCSADLRQGSGTAKFVMGTKGLKTKGEVDLGGTFADTTDAALSYKAGIYRKDNGKAVGTEKTADCTTTDGTAESFSFSATDIAPGTYLYTMTFYSKAAAAGNIVGSFTDTIVIDPGNKLTKTDFEIDVIGKKPGAPANLKAYLVKDSESSDGTTYEVKVTWDKGTYETNYELNLVEAKADGTFESADADGLIPNGTIYGMASMDTGAADGVKDFSGSDVFGTDSTSMMYADTSCVLRLETGKLYEIQIRARNYIGTSAWVDRIAGTDDTQGTAYAAPATQHLNRLLITYNLNGGTLTRAGTGTDETVTSTDYKSWTTDEKLLEITANGTNSDNVLVKNGANFAAWVLESGTALEKTSTDPDPETFAVTTTKGTEVAKYTYKNVNVKATFGNKVTGNISQADKTVDIDITDIKVQTDATGTMAACTPVNGIYPVSKDKTGGGSTTIQVTLDGIGAAPPKYTNLSVGVRGQSEENYESVAATAVAGQYQISTAKYTSGKIYVKVEADTSNAKKMSRTLVFDMQ